MKYITRETEIENLQGKLEAQNAEIATLTAQQCSLVEVLCFIKVDVAKYPETEHIANWIDQVLELIDPPR